MHNKNIIIIAKHKVYYKLINSIKANQITCAICVHFINIHIYVQLTEITINTYVFGSLIYPR